MSGVSCIITFYNEEGRVGKVVKTAVSSNLVSEVIAIGGGSDGGLQEVKSIKNPKLKIIEEKKKKGKAHALAVGVRKAEFDTILFLDADISGLKTEHIKMMTRPVMSGKYDVVLNDRRPTMGFMKGFITGERCFRKRDFGDFFEKNKDVDYAIEALMAEYMLDNNLKMIVIHLPGVKQLLQTKKRSLIYGIWAYTRMVYIHIRHLGAWGLARTFIRYLRNTDAAY